VLHDVFAVPFDEIAPIVGRTPTATRQLASRARRRVQGAPEPDVDLDEQWAVANAFLAAARDGDFEALLAVLDPDVVVRSDGGPDRPQLVSFARGARRWPSRRCRSGGSPRPRAGSSVNGTPGGVAWLPDGRPFAVSR
jgi:RNA polymerase sigma-70 factor (ECF subfamily)